MEQDIILEENEVMIERIRKHWFVYVEDALLHLFASVVFIVAAIYLSTQQKLLFLNGEIIASGELILVFFVLLFWTSFFYFWTKNYFDVWYATDQHIIAINQKQMFEREEAYMELGKIQDVTVEKNGILATYFGFGQLKVQTAGSDQVFVISDVSNVDRTAKIIMDLRDKAKG